LQKTIKHITLLLLLFISIWQPTAQIYPVQTTPQLVPPYSLKLSDYQATTSEKIVINLLMTDINEIGRQVRLKMYVEGQGLSIQTLDFVTGANNDIVQYVSNDSKFYIKHNSQDGKILFFDIENKKCIGFTLDQNEIYKNAFDNNNYETLIDNLKQIHGFKNESSLVLDIGLINLSTDKANVLLGKWNPSAHISGISEIGTDDIINGLPIFKNYTFADNVLELSPNSIHMLNIPDGMIGNNFFDNFNQPFLDFVISNKNNLQVTLVTNPSHPDLFKVWDSSTNGFKINPTSNLVEPSGFAKEIKYLRDNGITTSKLKDGTIIDLNSIDLSNLHWE
jgi:hypothetical protein